MIASSITVFGRFLDKDITLNRWENAANLPLFIRSLYEFHETVILDHECLILEEKDKLPRIEQMIIHMQRISEHTSKELVIYHRSVGAYRMKAYISMRIPFIAGSQHLFLPFLGLKMNNPLQSDHHRTTHFSPITQCVYLTFLYTTDLQINTTQMAQRLNISEMSASRALNELLLIGLLSFEWTGPLKRSKTYQRIGRNRYLSEGLPFLRSPVLRTIYSHSFVGHAPIAGLEALSEASTLNPSLYSVRAISSKQLSNYQLHLTNDPGAFPDEKIVEIQVWRYDPAFFSREGIIDPISLYVSLREDPDERIAHALESVLEVSQHWSMD